MNESKIFVSDEIDAPNKCAKSVNDPNTSNILNKECDTFNENRMPPAEFAPKLKDICEERKDPDHNLKEDKAKSLHVETLQVTSEERDEHSKENVAHQDAETEQRKEISGEKMVFKTNVEGFKDSKSAEIEKTKDDMLSKLETRSETSTLPLRSSQWASSPIPKYDSITRTQGSKTRSAKEVLEHFKWFMQCNTESLNRIKTDDISEKNIKPPESGICILEDLTKFSTESVNQDLEVFGENATKFTCQDSEDPMKTELVSSNRDFKDVTIAVTESTMTKDSEKLKNEVIRTDNSADATKDTRKNPRKRIVYDESVEHTRGWIIQQIKDREILLKFRIMEGKYSEDIETKMKSIEEANDLQDEIDMLFDSLDDYEKMENIPKRFKSCSNSTRKNSSKSSKKSRKIEMSEEKIKSFSSLFYHIYKSLNSESEIESVYKRISTRKFCSAFDAYLISKRKLDNESQRSEHIAKCAVESLHLSLSRSRLEMKCKIEHTEIRSLEDYQTYINDLKIAAYEHLFSLDQILPRVTSVILPLISYLSESRTKIVNMFAFLNEERSDVFLKREEIIKAFFKEFCQRHFKN